MKNEEKLRGMLEGMDLGDLETLQQIVGEKIADIEAEMFVSQIKNIYMDSIDECENILRRDLSTKWTHTPTKEAASILHDAVAIMRDVLEKQVEEQREAILDAVWKYVEDRSNCTCTSPTLMYKALASIEKAIEQAVGEYAKEEQKKYKKYSYLWHWCNYILYMVKNVVSTFAAKMQKGMVEDLKKPLEG